MGNLIRKIRENTGPDCLLTLPRRDGEAGVGLDMMATRDTAFSEFSRTTLTQGDETLRQTRTLLDPRQCPAVDYIRDNRDYPATRLGLRLDTPNVVSGNRITGVLRGTGGKYVALLLVDNNGVVQDLQRFLSQSGNFTRFDVPVTRAGPRRDTAQILLAVASSNPLQQIRDRSGIAGGGCVCGTARRADRTRSDRCYNVRRTLNLDRTGHRSSRRHKNVSS